MNDRDQTTADEDFAGKAKQRFDESVDGLDAETRSRLNRSRQAALAELGSNSRAWLHWAPAAGVAAAAVVALVLWTGNQRQDVIAPDATASDFEILLNEDELEMLEELEFFSWIELAEDATAAPAAEDQVG